MREGRMRRLGEGPDLHVIIRSQTEMVFKSEMMRVADQMVTIFCEPQNDVSLLPELIRIKKSVKVDHPMSG